MPPPTSSTKPKRQPLQAFPGTELEVQEITFLPQTSKTLGAEDLPMFEKLINMLNDCDDVQDVSITTSICLAKKPPGARGAAIVLSRRTVSQAASLSLRKQPIPTRSGSARSGAWSDTLSWENQRIPLARGDRVLVGSGHEILYDVASREAHSPRGPRWPAFCDLPRIGTRGWRLACCALSQATR